MIRLENVSYKYKDDSIALENINLELPSSGIIMIKGPNGAGKSTLLNLLAGILKPTTGTVYYNGKDINEIKRYTMNYIGYVAQQYTLFHELNVKKNIDFINKEYTQKLSEIFHIENILNKKVHEISGGEARRVSIVRTLNKQTKILLCDEPTESLDETNIKIIMEGLKVISKNTLVVIVTHNDTLTKYADQIIEIENHTLINEKIINESAKVMEENNTTSKIANKKLFLLAIAHLKQYKTLPIITTLILSIALLILMFSFSILKTDLNSIYAKGMITNNKNRINLYTYNDTSTTFIKKNNPTNKKFTYVYDYNIHIKIDNFQENLYYNFNTTKPLVAILNEDSILDKTKLVGSLPTNTNEIMINEYLYNLFKDYGVYNTYEQKIIPNSYEDIIGVTIKYQNKDVKITGVLKQDIKDYDYIKNVTEPNPAQVALLETFNNDIVLNNYIYVTPYFEQDLDYDTKENKTMYIESNSIEDLENVLNTYINQDYIDVTCYYTSLFEKLNNLTKFLKSIFIYVGIILLFISIIIICNYINHSIDNHKDTQYNLKYMGITIKQMSKIYLYELIIIYLVSVIISLLLTSIVIKIVNEMIVLNIFSNLSLLSINIKVIVEVVLLLIPIILLVYLLGKLKINKQLKEKFN